MHIGTCSWKYDSWRGLVYSNAPRLNHLAEYARKYDCVEVDQWFWSLFAPDKVVLPKDEVVSDYAAAVAPDFRFGIKLPNALTLTHFRPASKSEPLVGNPHFLSEELLRAFLETLEPLKPQLGPMMLQFEYLNRKKMPSQAEFLDKLGAFVRRLPKGYAWCVETRNPNHLNAAHFRFLREHGVGHVFLQGYYMPPIFETYHQFADQLAETVVIRLHGPDREGMEERTGSEWTHIVESRDAELDALAEMLGELKRRRHNVWVFVNNHYEGCAPLTIGRIRERMP